jgi:hypothetical protein
MLLSNTRFIQIKGTHVTLLAANDDEARTALRELRHKKKELLHYKQRLQRRRDAIIARSERETRTGTSPEMSPFAFVARSMGAVILMLTGWNPFPGAPLPTTLAAVNEDIGTLEEVLLNINEATLHVEGKLMLV